MSLQFSKKQILVLIGGILAIAALFVSIYFNVLSPLQLKKKIAAGELQTEQALLGSEKKQEAPKTEQSESTEMLQKKVPVTPLLEQYLLDLEKAEGLAGIRIGTIAVEQSGNDVPETTNETTVPSIGMQSKNNSAVKTTVESGPDGLQKLIVNMKVQYALYEQLQTFLTELEELPRITTIESVSFKGREEILSYEQPQQSHEAEITVSAYYMPSLKELEKQAPKLELPPLCEERTNPVEPQACK